MRRKHTAPRALTRLLGLSFIFSLPVTGAQRSDLTLEALFATQEYVGQEDFSGSWSHDDRYYALLWHPFKVAASDVWLYDTDTRQFSRLTSSDMMASFDAEAADDYPGIEEFAWANHANELLFSYRGDLYRLDVGSKRPRRLTRTAEAESEPRYTRDDRGFRFARGMRLFRMDFGSAYVEEFTPPVAPGQRRGNYSLSPDESKLLYKVFPSESRPEHSFNYMDYQGRFPQVKTTQRSLAGNAYVSDSYLYIFDLRPRDPARRNTPWEIAHVHADPRLGGIGVQMYGSEAWSPDSQRVTFSTWQSAPAPESFIKVADLGSRSVVSVYTLQDATHPILGKGDEQRPAFTPDGRKIEVSVVLGTPGFHHPALIDPATGSLTPLTRGDFDAYLIASSPDQRVIYVDATKESVYQRDLYRVEPATDTWQRLTRRFGIHEVIPGHRLEKFAAVHASWAQLPELFISDRRGERQITHSHDDERFRALHKIEPMPFSYRGRAGQTLYGYLYYPPDFRATDRRPLLFYAYGGPNVTPRILNRHDFNMYMAHRHGYVTAVIDPRGGPGFGKAYERANWEAPGKAQLEDLVDGVRYLIARGGIDPQRVGFLGKSYSGYLAQLAVYTEPDVFKLAISIAGVSEWQNYHGEYVDRNIGVTAKPLGEDLDRYSLRHRVNGLRAPLMLMHGMNDTTVFFQDTLHIYQALLAAGKGPLVELAVDPVGDHDLGGTLDWAKAYAIIESFLLRRWP